MAEELSRSEKNKAQGRSKENSFGGQNLGSFIKRLKGLDQDLYVHLRISNPEDSIDLTARVNLAIQAIEERVDIDAYSGIKAKMERYAEEGPQPVEVRAEYWDVNLGTRKKINLEFLAYIENKDFIFHNPDAL